MYMLIHVYVYIYICIFIYLYIHLCMYSYGTALKPGLHVSWPRAPGAEGQAGLIQEASECRGPIPGRTRGEAVEMQGQHALEGPPLGLMSEPCYPNVLVMKVLWPLCCGTSGLFEGSSVVLIGTDPKPEPQCDVLYRGP